MDYDLSKLTKEELKGLKKTIENGGSVSFTSEDQVKNLDLPKNVSTDADFSSYEGELDFNIPNNLPRTNEELEQWVQEREKREQGDTLEADSKASETHHKLH